MYIWNFRVWKAQITTIKEARCQWSFGTVMLAQPATIFLPSEIPCCESGFLWLLFFLFMCSSLSGAWFSCNNAYHVCWGCSTYLYTSAWQWWYFPSFFRRMMSGVSAEWSLWLPLRCPMVGTFWLLSHTYEPLSHTFLFIFVPQLSHSFIVIGHGVTHPKLSS